MDTHLIITATQINMTIWAYERAAYKKWKHSSNPHFSNLRTQVQKLILLTIRLVIFGQGFWNSY